MTEERGKVWRDIWNKKGRQSSAPLHHVDGFDLLDADQWERMVYQITRPIGIKNGDSVLECGCGAGAFLLGLLKYYPGLKVSGIDYSETLLEVARKNLKGDFFSGDITDIGFLKDAQFDHVVSFSTFHYLSSEEAARKAVREMVRVAKPGGGIFVGEVSDCAKRAIAAAIRKVTHKDHKRVSAEDPDHLFLQKELFRELAVELNLGLRIVDQDTLDLPFYETARYRYSVYLTKN